jgi:2-polyprenyl-3-methyl-5-hydroxy-6-metoxy-1,4-benzoquinol methylase
VGDEELAAVIQAVKDRARAASPNGSIGIQGIPAPDFLPLVHARDAAEAKVAAIGTVNPRPPGLKNAIAQKFKRLISRMLDWHVREQVEFNRASMACVQASLELMTDLSRALAAVAAHQRQFREDTLTRERQIREDFAGPIQELLDIRRHWAQWRVGFEDRRNVNEIHMLRTISELQSAFQHRVTLMDQSFRESVHAQHADFTHALADNTKDVQQRLWGDLVKMRGEVEALIYTELRLLRQQARLPRAAAAETPLPVAHGPAPQVAAPAEIAIDWMRFADTFRGREEDIRARQKRHASRFAGTEGEILDIGCGRGEFLEAAGEAGLKARGIDLSKECVELCHGKGLTAEQADLFTYLDATPDRSLGGIFCAQVVEHLPPERLPGLVRLMAAKMRQGALLAIETPNPECLAIFATHFYIDPTHTRPVPSVLLRFYLEEAGLGKIEVERLAPAADSIPALKELPPALVEALFGGLDYAIFAQKL